MIPCLRSILISAGAEGSPWRKGGERWCKKRNAGSRIKQIEIAIMALLFTDHGVLGKFLCLAEP
jgi:hypothetical protein